MTHEYRLWAMLPAMSKDLLNGAVQQYEAADLEGVWAVQLYGSPFVPLAAAASASEKLKLGSGVALAFTRSPLETACSLLELDAISNGRAVMGLGPSIKHWNENWYGVEYGKPLAHLRETIAIVREIIAKGHEGSIGSIDTEYYNLDLSGFKLLAEPVRTEIPLYLPAVYEKTTQMAGEMAEGLLGHPVWSTRWVRESVAPNLKVGLDKAGRSREDFDLNLFLFTAISDDKSEALADARDSIAFYGQMQQYERYFDAIGFGDEARALQQAAGDWDAMRRACSDDMVDAIALTGSAAEVRKRVGELAEFADSFTLAVPFYNLAQDKMMAYTQAIGETFY